MVFAHHVFTAFFNNKHQVLAICETDPGYQLVGILLIFDFRKPHLQMKDFNHSETASYNTLARTLCQVNFLPCIDEFDKNFSYDFSMRISFIIQIRP